MSNLNYRRFLLSYFNPRKSMYFEQLELKLMTTKLKLNETGFFGTAHAYLSK